MVSNMDINPLLKSRVLTDFKPSCSKEKTNRPTYTNRPQPFNNLNGCVGNSNQTAGEPMPYNLDCKPPPKGNLSDSGLK